MSKRRPEATDSDVNAPDSPDIAFSLLWPAGMHVTRTPLGKQAAADLGLDSLVRHFIVDRTRQDYAKDILQTLCRDEHTIRFRLDVLDDLLRHEPLIVCLEELIPVLQALRYFTAKPVKDDWTPFQETVFRLRELEHYVKSVGLLTAAFVNINGSLRSEGLERLRTLMENTAADPVYKNLTEALPGLLSTIDRLKSISIGVNLNGAMQPYEAVLLSIDSKEYTDGGFYTKLTGRSGRSGIAPLHSSSASEYSANPLMIPLFRDIAGIMNKSIQPAAAALKAFVSVNSRLMVKLQDEFLFFLGAVRLIRTVRGFGLPMSRPEILPEASRETKVQELFNLPLALRTAEDKPDASGDLSAGIIGNDFTFSDDGRIVVLTGPNRGGKTTFLQSLGIAQVLFQAGMYVPASAAAMSTADTILTHYPALEIPEKGTGRFGEEAERLKTIFGLLTKASLVLMNESLSSTSMGESLFLAEDLLRVLRTIGCRAVFATHLHQLASDADKINTDTEGSSRVISMVSTIEEVMEDGRYTIRPTFRIVQGPPAGQSYALELAVRFGISRDQLLAGLKDREKG